MKPFPEHNQDWVDSLPFYGFVSRDQSGRFTRVRKDGLFPGSVPAKREHVEGGFTPEKRLPVEDVMFNVMMTQDTAAFADIIGSYTRTLYGRDRTLAFFKILSLCYQRSGEAGFGTRAWLYGVCNEALRVEEI